jgi:hypothetical protein
VKFCRRLRLDLKALFGCGRVHMHVENQLESHQAIQTDLPRAIDKTHTPSANLRDQFIITETPVLNRRLVV